MFKNVILGLAVSLLFPVLVLSQEWQQQWVQREVELQTSRGRMGHYQSCPAGYKAGVGFSTISPEAAVRQCCFWFGSKRPRGIKNFDRYPIRYFHVSKGPRGWYAAALYK